MDRRSFIGKLALGILAVPRLAPAQPERKVYRIGVLSHIAMTSDLVGPQPRQPSVNALVQGLRELGYVYGEHFVTEPRGAGGRPERLPNLVGELVRLQVDVIVAPGPTLAVLKQATSTIPVVMTGAGDPVSQGYVQSLGRPGGNFTGLSTQTQELVGKRLELLKELVPGAAPVAVLWDPRADRLSWAGSRIRSHGTEVEADLAGDSRCQPDRGSSQGGDRRARRGPARVHGRGPGPARPANRGPGCQEPPPCDVWTPILCRGRRADLL